MISNQTRDRVAKAVVADRAALALAKEYTVLTGLKARVATYGTAVVEIEHPQPRVYALYRREWLAVQADHLNAYMHVYAAGETPAGWDLPRHADRQDALIMKLRTEAHLRGATPAEIQRNVAALDSDDPKDCIPRPARECW